MLWFPVGFTGIAGEEGRVHRVRPSQKHPKMQATHELGIGLLGPRARWGGPAARPRSGARRTEPQRAQHGPEGLGFKL